MKALLWDVDGTIAETEDGHRIAFNRAFEIQGLPWRWDDEHYGALLAVTGGRERLLFDMTLREDAPFATEDLEALAGRLHQIKNEVYAQLVREGAISWRAGVFQLMEECRSSGLPMAIATTTSRTNVDALLRTRLGPSWCEWFSAIVCGEDVRRKKPDPEVYMQALGTLGIAAHEAVAIEDSPQGGQAARAAGAAVLITRSAYFPDAMVAGAIAIGPGLHMRDGWQPPLPPKASDNASIDLADIAWWHGTRAQAPTSS